DPAERDPDELPAEGARDALAERRLAHTGRSDQREDRARTASGRLAQPALLAELADSQVLEDPILHVLQALVVGVEHDARLGDVQVVVRTDVPRDLDHPVEVRADPALLGRLLGRPLQAAQLAQRLFLDVLRHAGLGDLLAVLLDDVLFAVLAELFADRAHLLAQQELALALLHALADVRPDLVLQLQ